MIKRTKQNNKTILFDVVNAPLLHVFLQTTHLVYPADYPYIESEDCQVRYPGNVH